MASIRVEHLCKIYNQGKENEVVALNDVSFSAEEGEFIVIIGPSGAGKSTLLNLLGGMDVSTSGSYWIGDEDASKFNAKQLQLLRRDKIGFVFQFYNLMPNLTALENVALAASVVDNAFDPKTTLEGVGLGKRLGNFPSELSGGEQQRVAIARALVKNPALLLCDEPTGALDSKTGASIIKLLSDVCASYKKTVLMVTHNAKIASVAKRVLKIADGKIVEDIHNDHPLKPEEVSW